MDAFDLTGGYDPSADSLLPERPTDPAMRESVSMWISDDAGRFGLPRFCIEAVGGEWENRGVEANIAFPDGRVLIGAGGFGVSPPRRVDGRPVTLNAGPLTFEVVEPLRRWRMTFDGGAYETTVMQQVEGETTGTPRSVRIEVDATMAAPPWNPGERAQGATAFAIGAVGGHRHEQLFRCRGQLHVEGEAALDFEGRGLLIRRWGVRSVGDFPGHCWQSALFPSGKAFGMLGFPSRKDGTPAYGEAFLFDGRRKAHAKLIEAPWMTKFVPHGGAVDLVLEADGKPVRIRGRTHDSTFIAAGNPMFGDWTLGGMQQTVALPFHQGGALYTWDGESAYGMVERSLPADRVRGI
jgi:hypothetical protein